MIVVLNTSRKLISGVCSTHGGSEKCKWNLNRKTEEVYLFWVPGRIWQENYKIYTYLNKCGYE
jgi:hypothetical protein